MEKFYHFFNIKEMPFFLRRKIVSSSDTSCLILLRFVFNGKYESLDSMMSQMMNKENKLCINKYRCSKISPLFSNFSHLTLYLCHTNKKQQIYISFKLNRMFSVTTLDVYLLGDVQCKLDGCEFGEVFLTESRPVRHVKYPQKKKKKE